MWNLIRVLMRNARAHMRFGEKIKKIITKEYKNVATKIIPIKLFK